MTHGKYHLERATHAVIQMVINVSRYKRGHGSLVALLAIKPEVGGSSPVSVLLSMLRRARRIANSFIGNMRKQN